MKRKLTLKRTSQPTILTEQEISAMVDQFLDGELARTKDGTLTQEQVIGIAAEELRLQLENEIAKQYRGEH